MSFYPKICWKKAKGKGRGVFTREKIREGSVIEKCPVILVADGLSDDKESGLFDYCFDVGGTSAIALGFGSLYNHSDEPNVEWTDVPRDLVIVFHALRDIDAGEELTIDYGIPLWFKKLP